MTEAMQHLSSTEKRIIRKILDNAKGISDELRDVKIIVRDEEEEVYCGAYDREAIEGEIGHTGMTQIIVRLQTGELVALALIHGNEEDVISDIGLSKGAEWLEKRLCEGAAE